MTTSARIVLRAFFVSGRAGAMVSTYNAGNSKIRAP